MLSLQERMKAYEYVPRLFLMKRNPVIIRIDGKAFHTFTKGLEKPFDNMVEKAMIETTKYLCKNIQGCKIGYTQSDEISLFLTDYDTLETEGWFNYNLEKMTSIAASMATLAFNNEFNLLVIKEFDKRTDNKIDDFASIEEYNKALSDTNLDVYFKKRYKALFDARAFNIPKEDVTNYFVWRQRDAIRNSKQAVGQANFPAKNLFGLNTTAIVNKLADVGIMWEDYSYHQKRGVYITKEEVEGEKRPQWIAHEYTPLFEKERESIDKFI